MLLLKKYGNVKKNIEFLEYKKTQYKLGYLERRKLEKEIELEKLFLKCIQDDIADGKVFI